MCHMRCENAQAFDLQVLSFSNVRVNPSFVQSAGGTLVTILGDLLEKITINTSEWFCNFAGNMILVQNSTCLYPSLPSGSNQLSIVNMQQVFGSVSIFAIPNKINSLSSSVLLSHRNHSLKVVLTHPLSGFNFHLIVGLDQYPCFPASKYEKLGYISFTCVVQTSEPGQMFVKLCGAYCTSESAVLVEESPVVTISSEKCCLS